MAFLRWLLESHVPVGVTKLDALSKFFNSVVDGTADLGVGDDVKHGESVADKPKAEPGHDEQVVLESAKQKASSTPESEHPKDEL
jgi:protein disulfide-isomerase A6